MLEKLDRKFRIREKLLEPLAPRVPPNLVSSFGFLTGPFAGLFLWRKAFLLALAFIFLNALSDLFDGIVARKYGRITKRGSLIDDLADRVSDVSISLGLGGAAGSPLLGAICAILLVFNSYLSLQGLALFGKKAKFGFFSRANRTAVTFLALAISLPFGFNPAGPLLYLTIAAAVLTIFQRATFLLMQREGRSSK
ncbi:MAG: CDP-alcohol phosphatidyltransferase family protein [archaeon]